MAAERYDAATMSDGSVWEIDDGWEVVGVDGAKVGVISDIEPDYIVISRGFLFSSERFVPVDAITSVEPGRVYLNVSRREIDQRGWTSPPVPASPVTLHDGEPSGYAGIAPVSGGDISPSDALDRRLADEQISINRQPVDRDLDGDDARSFAHIDMRVPIFGEIAVVRKQPVVYEMFGLVRGIRERRQRFSDVVRREGVEITREDTDPAPMSAILAAPDRDVSAGLQ